jgi:hypothetical protein
MIGLTARPTGLKTTQRQIISREVPEPLLVYQTRQVRDDLMHPSVWSSLLHSAHAGEANISVHQHAPDASPARPIR